MTRLLCHSLKMTVFENEAGTKNTAEQWQLFNELSQKYWGRSHRGSNNRKRWNWEKNLFTTTRPSDQCGKLVLPPCGGLPASVTAVMNASGRNEPEAKLLQWCRFAQMNEAAYSSSWVLKRRLLTKGCHEGWRTTGSWHQRVAYLPWVEYTLQEAGLHAAEGALESLVVHSV